MVWQGLAAQLASLVTAALQATLLRPFALPPAVLGMWAFMRDAGLGLVAVALAYGAVRSAVGVAAGQPGEPWALLPRAVVAAAGCQLSLALVKSLLSLNNLFVAGVLSASRPGLTAPLVAPVAASAGLGALSAGLAGALVPEALAVLLAVGLLWLSVTYLVRAAEIVFLALAAPVVAALWVVPQAADAWRVWLGELLTAVFVQSAQVLVLWAVVELGPWGGASGSVGGALESLLEGLASLVLLGRVRTTLRHLSGLLGTAPSLRLWATAERFALGGGALRGVRA
jgi:hypothetical protein